MRNFTGTKSFTTNMCGKGNTLVTFEASLIFAIQANVLVPSIFIAQEPQIPSRQERLNVRVESSSFLILIKASNTIGPQLKTVV